jgi:hypothetical protein
MILEPSGRSLNTDDSCSGGLSMTHTNRTSVTRCMYIPVSVGLFEWVRCMLACAQCRILRRKFGNKRNFYQGVLYSCAVLVVWSSSESAYVSEEHIASIFKVEEHAMQETNNRVTVPASIGFLLGLLLDPEYGCSISARNVGFCPNYTALQP